MIESIKKIFIAPHNDDEALFGCYTIMREKPLVVIVSDSYIQQEHYAHITPWLRRIESQKAMQSIGINAQFLGIPDNAVNDDIIRAQFKKLKAENPDLKIVFAPLVERGNILHDICGRIANEVFDNVLHYSTYTKTQPHPIGDIIVNGTQDELDEKAKILKYYQTQINKKEDKIYFEYALKTPEFFSSCYIPNRPTSLKEQALKNLVDFKAIMKQLSVPFYLMDGALLGAYRDCDLIRNDYDDIDVGIPEEYEHWANEIYKWCQNNGFTSGKRFEHDGKFEGGSVSRNGNHIDFFIIHKKDDDAFNLARNFLPNNQLPYMAYVYPRECFDIPNKITFKGMEFYAPLDIEKFLTARYGQWRTPLIREEGFDWLNQEQNPALRINYKI